MNKLMKYEFRKTRAAKLAVLAITALAEIVFLIGVFGNNDERTAIGIFLLAMCAMFGLFVIGVQSVVILHRDMSTRQSYMLFMTPNSRWSILGAKVLENGVSILLAGAFFAALAVADISLFLAKNHQMEQLWEMLNRMIQSFNSEIDISRTNFLLLALFMVSAWLSTVVCAYLADVVACALLTGKRASGAIAFVLFIVLNYLESEIISLAVRGMNFSTTMLVSSGLELVMTVIMYVCAATIMERKLSV